MKKLLIGYIDSLFDKPMTDDEMEILTIIYEKAIKLSEKECQHIVANEFPFLLEVESARERALNKVLNYVYKPREDDQEVDYLAYNSLLDQLKPLYNFILKDRLIQGFTPEDLTEIFDLKVYQVLARGQYNSEKNPRSFFKVVFKNLLNNLNARKDAALKNGCFKDGLDDCISFGDWMKESD